MKRVAVFLLILMLLATAVGLGAALLRRQTAPPPPVTVKPPSLDDWTPERIVADPEGYLDFCEQKVKDAVTRLRDRQEAIITARTRFQLGREEAAVKVATVEPIYQDLKLASDGATAWPITWAGEPRSADWAKRSLADLDLHLAARQKLIATYDRAIDRLNGQERDNRDQQNVALQQLAEIHTSREFVKIDRMSADLQKRLLEMRSMVQGVLVQADTGTGPITLDSLSEQRR
jgi:hypothetical protein